MGSVADKTYVFQFGEKMNKTVLTPILILTGILGIMAVMASTHLFTPVVAFIHNDFITPSQALACLLLTVFGFAAAFYFLNSLCHYFVPRDRKSVV